MSSLEARERIKQFIKTTPVMTCETLDQMAGAKLFFKCENFQKTGSFKARGALNAILTKFDISAGVATHSSGNHAQAVAFAAGLRGTRAYIVMPENSPELKKAAVRHYGGEITFCGPTLADREAALAEIINRTGAAKIHPYNDADVIAGQGTVALELLEQVPGLDAVIAPVGGGGLMSGITLALRGKTKVIGAEPLLADDAFRSLRDGKIHPQLPPVTIADGLRASLGELTFQVLHENRVPIVTVDEDEIRRATHLIWERMKIIVEPSSAVPLAAVLTGRADVRGQRLGIILTGGNCDPKIAF